MIADTVPSASRLQHEVWSETDETSLLAIHGDFDEERVAPGAIDIRPAIVMTVFTGILFAYYQGPLSLTSLIVSGSYLAGRIIKKLVDVYDFMRDLEEWGLKLVRKVPYFNIITTVLSLVVSLILAQLAYTLATGTGLISALTIDTESHAVAADKHALHQGSQSQLIGLN